MRVTVDIVLAQSNIHYHMMRIERRGNDIYGFFPGLGLHYSHHESGIVHFTPELTHKYNQPPVLVMSGCYEEHANRQWRCSIQELGRAEDIFTALFFIDNPKEDFKLYSKNLGNAFVINTNDLDGEGGCVQIGVWVVPSRNMVSFEFNNPGIASTLLYKQVEFEPQLWIYAKPLRSRND